jgi:hypothetical protein
MKKIILLLIFSLLSGVHASQRDYRLLSQEDRISEISNQFRQGNTKELSKYLSSSVNLSLMNNENVYSKVQSEIILDKFFKEYPPQSSKVIHRLDNNSNYQHAVLLLSTAKGDFRVAISLRGSEKDLQLIEIRIEKSN